LKSLNVPSLTLAQSLRILAPMLEEDDDQDAFRWRLPRDCILDDMEVCGPPAGSPEDDDDDDDEEGYVVSETAVDLAAVARQCKVGRAAGRLCLSKNIKLLIIIHVGLAHPALGYSIYPVASKYSFLRHRMCEFRVEA
jgi:hypothetical protein